MHKYRLILLFAISLLLKPDCSGTSILNPEFKSYSASLQDSLHNRQLLLNGRKWRSNYSNVRGHEFLFSDKFLQGNITINGKTFNNISLKYDILNDEIICPVHPWIYVQLNKEKVEGFDIFFNDRKYHFDNFRGDNIKVLQGYLNILYKGNNTALLIKYKKSISNLAIDGRFDEFSQLHHIYVLRDGVLYSIYGKKDLFRSLKERNQEIKDFIRQKKIKVSMKNPDSFIKVLEYYDSLNP
jgi:hypothetical protein